MGGRLGNGCSLKWKRSQEQEQNWESNHAVELTAIPGRSRRKQSHDCRSSPRRSDDMIDTWLAGPCPASERGAAPDTKRIELQKLETSGAKAMGTGSTIVSLVEGEARREDN